jgi:thioredoxin 1
MSDIIYVDDSSFEAEVMNSKLPVLIDFTAEWCGPCKKQAPILEALSANKANVLKIVKVDIDESPSITSKFGVRSVPSMLLIKDGQKVDLKVGLTSLADLTYFVSQKLGI